MKNDYVWIFNEVALGLGIKGAFSLEYHVPKAKLKVDPSKLVGSKLWLVIRNGDESFLYAMLVPSTIEIYQEGKYEGDYLLCSEIFFSVRFLPRHESREPWKLHLSQAEEEIRECTNDEQIAFGKIVDLNHRVSFAAPSRLVVDSIPRTAFKEIERAVPDQLMSTLRTVAFGDVTRAHSSPNTVSAFGSITLDIIKMTHPNLIETDIINLIAALDPMAKIMYASRESQQDVFRTLSSLPPIVDTFIEEIDLDKISPRTFVAGTPNYSSEWIEKTNDAEREHEKILKELVLRLKEKGFNVYKSRSFDVFAEKDELRLLWEIKSSNGFNSVAQGEKGIVQLLRYSIALSNDKWGGVKFLLLLQDSERIAVQEYLSKMADRAGIGMWFYDEKNNWPHRVFNLKSETLAGL